MADRRAGAGSGHRAAPRAACDTDPAPSTSADARLPLGEIALHRELGLTASSTCRGRTPWLPRQSVETKNAPTVDCTVGATRVADPRNVRTVPDSLLRFARGDSSSQPCFATCHCAPVPSSAGVGVASALLGARLGRTGADARARQIGEQQTRLATVGGESRFARARSGAAEDVRAHGCNSSRRETSGRRSGRDATRVFSARPRSSSAPPRSRPAKAFAVAGIDHARRPQGARATNRGPRRSRRRVGGRGGELRPTKLRRQRPAALFTVCEHGGELRPLEIRARPGRVATLARQSCRDVIEGIDHACLLPPHLGTVGAPNLEMKVRGRRASLYRRVPAARRVHDRPARARNDPDSRWHRRCR